MLPNLLATHWIPNKSHQKKQTLNHHCWLGKRPDSKAICHVRSMGAVVPGRCQFWKGKSQMKIMLSPWDYKRLLVVGFKRIGWVSLRAFN